MLILVNSYLAEKEIVEKLTYSKSRGNYIPAKEELEDRNILVTTIDKFAYKVYENYAQYIGCDSNFKYITCDYEKKSIFIEWLRRCNIDVKTFLMPVWQSDVETTFNDCLKVFEDIKNNEFIDNDSSKYYPTYCPIYEEYRAALYDAKYVDREDIIGATIKIFINHSWVLNIYKNTYNHILISSTLKLNSLEEIIVKYLVNGEI